MGDEDQGRARIKAGPFPFNQVMDGQAGSRPDPGQCLQDQEELIPIGGNRDPYLGRGIGHEPNGPSDIQEFIGQGSRSADSQLKRFLIFTDLLPVTVYIQYEEDSGAGAGIKLPYVETTLPGRRLPVDTIEWIVVTVVTGACRPVHILVKAPGRPDLPNEVSQGKIQPSQGHNPGINQDGLALGDDYFFWKKPEHIP